MQFENGYNGGLGLLGVVIALAMRTQDGFKYRTASQFNVRYNGRKRR